jgi:hypothetical protein
MNQFERRVLGRLLTHRQLRGSELILSGSNPKELEPLVVALRKLVDEADVVAEGSTATPKEMLDTVFSIEPSRVSAVAAKVSADTV